MTALQEDKQPSEKMGKGLVQTFLQGRHTESPETYEKMFSITSHQRHANYNHNEVPSHTSQSGQQTNQQTNVGEDAEKREPLCTVGGNAD